VASDQARQHYQDGQRSPETDRRRSSMELSSSAGHLGWVAAKRQQSVSEEAKEIAWKAQTPAVQAIRETGGQGQRQRKIVTAAGRELLGFIWAIGTKAEATARQRMAA